MIIEKIKIYKNMQGLYNVWQNTFCELEDKITTVAFSSGK